MTERADNPILELLGGIRTDVDSIREDVHEVKARVTSLERSLARISSDLADQRIRENRLLERIEGIEKRLKPAR